MDCTKLDFLSLSLLLMLGAMVSGVGAGVLKLGQMYEKIYNYVQVFVGYFCVCKIAC